jgi:hypothetical protein
MVKNREEDNCMSNHQASEQMIGYLYQVRYALSLLLENDNSDFQISIEKFDDIAFSKDDEPKQLIQVKHHVQKHGSLTDASTDLWRTLKVWIDIVTESPDILKETEFVIITTAVAPDDTAASCLRKDDKRNVDSAYGKLRAICDKSDNVAHKKFYDAFLKTDESVLKRLIGQICVIDSASNIIDVEKTFRKQIRYSCVPKFENQICERLEGWWYKKAIEALCSEKPIFVTQSQIRSLIVSISQEYADDNLPIDIWEVGDFQESDLGANEKIFYEQLKLISLGSRRMQTALRDYYRAFKQRANWIRNDLLYVNELESYEQRLIDEWEHSFAAMEDDIAECCGITEDEKIKEGRRLFTDIEKKDVRIRSKCQEAFVMRGSYHILANQLKVGWHADFYTRLVELLNT